MEFIEAPLFTKLLKRYLDDDSYRLLQLALALDPEKGDLIPDTGGFRKIRWKDERRGEGKRGGLRVVYYHFQHDRQVWLLTLYGKGEMKDLSATEKRLLRAAIEQEKRARKTRRRK